MVDTLGQLTTSSEGLPDTQKKLQELASSITQRISTEKDTYEKADSDLKELSQHLEKKEYVKAIATLLKLLFNSFSLKSSNGFAHLDKYLKQLHLDGKTQTEILTLIQKFSEDLEKSNFSISDITDTTFLLSACKDRRFQMECQTKQQQSPTPYDSLLYHLHHNLSNTGSSPKDPTGTILLFNRWATKAETSGLKSRMKDNVLNPRIQSTSGSGFQHAVIISRVENDGTLRITHAHQDGVVEEKMETYLWRRRGTTAPNVDVMAVDLPDGKWPEVAQFAQSKLGAKYDIMGMAHDTLAEERDETNSKNLVVKNDPNMFYCSELIFSGLEASWYTIDKHLFTPGDIAKAFKPHYCSTLNTSKLERNLSLPH